MLSLFVIVFAVNGNSALAKQPLSDSTLSLLPRLFAPVPPSEKLDTGKVKLGERLFHDPALSKDGTVACANCHDIASGGDDGLPVSAGIDGNLTRRNSQTVLNVGLQRMFFWDGRARSLADQIDGPVTSKQEMAGDWPTIVKRLSADKSYQGAFKGLYGGVISEKTIKDAIVQYEKSLNTPGARFDKFLKGDRTALSLTEQKGLNQFVRLGCAACHQGPLFGGNLFQKSGVYHAMGGQHDDDHDLGRFEVTGVDAHKHMFKVPSLRNIELTAPYFHDGSAEDLDIAVRMMARMQLNKDLSDDTVDAIVAFLKTLTGTIPTPAITQEAKR